VKGCAAAEQFGDVVIADAEAAGEEDASHADGNGADGGPPHPVNVELGGEVLELVLEAVHEAAEERAGETNEEAEGRGGDEELLHGERAVDGDGEQRSGAEPVNAKGSGKNAGDGDGDEGARPPLEQEELDGEQDGGDGRGKGGGHASGRAGDEQGGALVVAQLEPLGDEGANGAARHNDGAFRAEGAARTDGERGRDGFQDGDLGLDARSAKQDGFNGLGNAVSANFVRAVVGHEADDETADDGHDGHEPMGQCGTRRADHGDAEAVVIEEVGAEGNGAQQENGAAGGESSNDEGNGTEQPYAAIDGKIAQC